MKNFDQIERYLNGAMTEAEKQAFEVAISQNPELAEEVQLQAFEEDVIDLMVEEELRQQVREIRAEAPVATKKKQSFLKIRWIQIAAAASVILIAGYFIGNNLKPDLSPAELASEYYEQYSPNFSGTKGSGTDPDEEKKYLNSLSTRDLSKMDQVIAFYRLQEGADALYKLSHAYYLKKDFAQAAQSLQKYLDLANPTDREYPRAQFYLALSYLADQQIAAAKQQLSTIQNSPDHLFKVQAEKLLEELDKE